MIGYGALSDRVGRAPVYLFGAVAMAVARLSVLLDDRLGSTALILVAFATVIPICHAAMIGVQPSLLTEMFPADIRYSGVALRPRDFGSAAAGGLAPVVGDGAPRPDPRGLADRRLSRRPRARHGGGGPARRRTQAPRVNSSPDG